MNAARRSRLFSWITPRMQSNTYWSMRNTK